ncbi:hypothetical protein CDL15_Pgr012058 [Punica granatum]|uniref:Leucine-rich repeat-containing N-terminal plant-type domain-containing protein n=2 Tax=Punica granatum TaxID=22663 RepID=A0A218XM07_PUNGR|nr:hypothetical protein CDL15_Pgr012058 [Punica granatum]
MFARLKNLEFLWLRRNLNVMLPNNGNCSFPRLKELSLHGFNLTEFPYSLSSLEELEWLDISRDKINEVSTKGEEEGKKETEPFTGSSPAIPYPGRRAKMRLLVLLFLLLHLHIHLSSAAAAGHLPELRGLLSIKSSLVFDPVSEQPPLGWWNSSVSHCLWSGVTCSPRTGHVTALDLSGLNISCPVPPQISSLTALSYLNLSDNFFNESFPAQLAVLKNLQVLDLYNNNMSGPLPFIVTQMSALRHLHLGGNFFNGSIPPEYGQWEFLEYLGVQGNELSGAIPPEIGNLTKLKELYVGYNNIYEGGLPLQIGNLLELVRLDAASCGLSGEIPIEIGKLQKLDTLFLHMNSLSGPLTRELGQLSSLKSMDLSENMLSGEIPESFSQLKNLTLLCMFRNKLHGSIPDFIGDLPQLEVLQLWENNFTGSIPVGLGENGKLQFLDLSSNKLTGTLPPDLCMFRGVINEIPLPPRLKVLSLSNNQFSGQLPIVFFRNSNVELVDLANNNFDGPLPIPSPNVWFYSAANNKFSGDIPHQLCNATLLRVVILSNNSLNGSIPHCFINLSASVLDLRANKLVGHIPDIFFSWNNLRTIQLSQNQLEGTLPRSLANCKNLEVLDLSDNELEGRFPNRLGTLPNLQVLNLRSNKLRGLINSSRKNNHPFPKLHIFDLSDNSFCGHLPAKYIANFIAIKDESRSSLQYMGANDTHATWPPYQDSVTVVMKGFAIKLVRILTVFTTIDFSRNFFGGDIPELIGDLKALKGLNFSHNNLTGKIPSSVGNLTNLEWLDLSSNKLNGEIPRGLADLSWLCWLNLSDNQFVGPIPQSTQFDTFDHSFDGNPGLCGHPLPKACGVDNPQSPPPTSPEDGEKKAQGGNWIKWKAVAMGYGCGISFGISAGYVMLETRRSKWLVRTVERWLVGRDRKTNRPKKKCGSKKSREALIHDRFCTLTCDFIRMKKCV